MRPVKHYGEAIQGVKVLVIGVELIVFPQCCCEVFVYAYSAHVSLEK